MDEQTAQEETEDKLKQCIDNLMDKRYLFFFFFHPVTVKVDTAGNITVTQRVVTSFVSLSVCVSLSALRRG